MKDIWYADKRDIVKWGGIVYLCSKKGIKNVVQIAYYRRQQWLKLVFDKANVNLPEQVIKHFRDIEDINRLALSMSLTIKVIKKEFSHNTRTSYHRHVCEVISAMKEQKIVFLDPDVGLAPNRCKAEHVKPDEITMIWQSLNPQDFLVFYQHRFRSRDWVEIRRNQLAAACGVETKRVRTWSAEQIKDVVFFFIEKLV